MSSLPCRLKQQRVERKNLHQWNGYQRVVYLNGFALDLTVSSLDLIYFSIANGVTNFVTRNYQPMLTLLVPV